MSRKIDLQEIRRKNVRLGCFESAFAALFLLKASQGQLFGAKKQRAGPNK
jgi:hypothetical protein